MVWWVLVVSSVSSLRWHEKTATLLSTTKTSSNTTYISISSSADMESFWLSISLIFISYFFGKWSWILILNMYVFEDKSLLSINFCQPPYFRNSTIWIKYFQEHHLVTNIAGGAGLKNFGYLWDLYIKWGFGRDHFFKSFILKESLLQIFFFSKIF